MRRVHTVIFLVLGMLGGGCGSNYQAPTVAHVYTTSTQDYHDLSGLTIVCRPARDALANATAGALLGSKEYQVFYVDGRTVLTTDGVRPAETFLQLPPGQHEIVTTNVIQGLVTGGGKAGRTNYRIRFVLGRGASARLTAVTSWVQSLEGVESYEVLEGEQTLGRTIVNSPAGERPKPSGPRDLESALLQLKELRDQGLISNEVYQQKALQILSSQK